jgi:hypothetical protein
MRPLPNGDEIMDSNELRFKHIGLSSDRSVIFCELNHANRASHDVKLNKHMLDAKKWMRAQTAAKVAQQR